MIIDKLATFAQAQTITGGSTTTSTDYADIGATRRRLGNGEQLYLVFHVTAKSGGDGSDTFSWSLVTADDTGFSTNKETVCLQPTITGVANVTDDTIYVVPVPPQFNFRRYIRAEYAVTANAVLTADCYLTNQKVPESTPYSSGSTV